MKMDNTDLILFVGALLTGFPLVLCDCEVGWKRYNDNCYFFSDARHRYPDYEHVCSSRNASVFVWHSQGELDWVTSQITTGPRIMYWTGLKLVNRHWRWADGTPYSKTSVKWYRNQEGNTRSGNLCSAIYSYVPQSGQIGQQHCTRASWGSICVRPKDMVDLCDLANNWHYVNGICLKFFETPVPWYDARMTCQDQQGDLTQYKDYNQLLLLNDIVSCRTKENNVWIGLSDTVQPRTWRWVNNDTVHYQRWYSYGNQILKNGSTCAAASAIDSWSWRNYLCDTPLKFVCNRSVGVCPTGWIQNQDRCYQPNVVDASKKTWFDAKKYCESIGNSGSLLIINSDVEQQFISQKLHDLHVNRAWLAFSDANSSDLLAWIDGHAVVNTSIYQHWDSNFPRTDQKRYDCGLITRTAVDAKWSNGYCFNSEPFFCEMKVTDRPFITPPPNATYHCDPDWILYNKKCYYFGPLRNQSSKTWDEAKAYCQATGGSLVVIGDPYEVSFVTVQQQSIASAWIGLRYKPATKQLTWVDGSVAGQHWTNETNFAPGGSNDVSHGLECIQIGGSGRQDYAGSWFNENCSTAQGFICEKTAYPGQGPPPSTTVSPTNSVDLDQTATIGAVSSGSTVFVCIPKLADDRRLWRVCTFAQAHLSLRPGTEISCAGSNNDLCTVYKNSECCGEAAPATMAHLGNHQCVVSMRQKILPVRCSLSAQCGAGWIFDSLENFCYQIVLNSPKTWVKARADCKQKGSDLVSISGRREQNFLQGLLSSGIYASMQVNFWIGATDQTIEGGWSWTDGSPFRFLNWYPGEPNNYKPETVPEDCGEMVPGWSYRWNDKRCNIEQLYICKKAANITSISPYTSTQAPITKTCVGEPMISGNYSLIDNQAFSASSSRDASHLPANSRWYSGSMGSWSALQSNSDQWISASFFSTIVVTGITTAGRTDNDEWITSYKIQYQTDFYSEWLTYNDPPGKPKIFTGNNDSHSAVTNNIIFPFEARIVKLVPLQWNSGISLRWEIIGCFEEDCNPDYGVSGPLVVPDTAMTSSTEFDSRHGASTARIRSIIPNMSLLCWRPQTTDTNPWLQIDLGQSFVIRGITTRGDPSTTEWVTQFKIQYSSTGSPGTFTYYQEPYNQVKTITGNFNNSAPMTYVFKAHFRGRFIRVLPTAWHNKYPCLKVDILVCPKGCKGIALISGTNPVGDNQLNASSVLNNYYGAFRSRLNQPSEGSYAGAWMPRFMDKHQFIQVDLGYTIYVTAIATQGAEDSQDWVRTYHVTYSQDGRKWLSYFETGTSPEVFDGNWDNNSVRKHFFTMKVLARYVRLWPHSYNNRIAVRWEVYGCPGPDSGIHIGCYADDPHDHDLSYEPFTDPKVGMWPPMCMHHCFNHGYLYAGVQNQYKCFCGNSYGRYGPSTDCTLSCVFKTEYFCGGPASNIIYSTRLTPQFKICPPQWKAYKDQCYILLLDKRSWYGGRAACQGVGADLASPNDQQQQDFVYSLLQYGNRNDAWIGFNDIQDESLFQWSRGQQVKYTNWNLNAPKQQANADEDCVIMTNNTGGWQDEACDSLHEFVCQMDKKTSLLPSPTPGVSDCEKGWDGYRWSCYLYADSPRNWQDAKSLCATFGGTQVRIDDRFEQAYLASVLGTKRGQYWTDVTDTLTPDTYQYSDGNKYLQFTNWAPNKPDASRQCISMGSGNVSGLWFNTDCNRKLGTVCEKMRIGYTSPPPATSLPITASCDVGQIQTDQYCYQVNVQPGQRQLRWSEALNDCTQKGGTLATFHNATDLDKVWRLGLVGASTASFWIGLNDRDHKNGYEWADKSSVNYLNWGLNQPDNFLGIENCVEMNPSTSTWNDVSCFATRNWICAIKRGSQFSQPTTIPAPTPGPSSKCGSRTDWKYYNSYCYKANDGNGNNGKGWRQARAVCQQAGGDLASILTLEEQQFIYQRLLTNIGAYGVWIGLNDLQSEKQFRWADGSPFIYTAWDTNQPDNFIDSEDCVHISLRHGKWNDAHCATKYGYVCKAMVGSTPTPIAPTSPWIGFCPVGYSLLHNKCYRVFNQAVNWTTARTICQQEGSGYDLASVQSDEENAFLVQLLSDMSVNPWLGMRSYWWTLSSTAKYFWINQADVTYTNFAAGEPNDKQESCIQMYGIPSKAGQWRDNGCWDREGFVCQTTKLSSILTPEPTPNVCDVGQHFQQYQASCYLFVSQPMNWTDATAKCSTKGASLTSINSPYEQAFIFLMLRQQHSIISAIWTGLNDRQISGTYIWSDNWPVMYTNWDRGEPVRLDNGGCVKFNNTGRWSDSNCANKYPFICKISQAKPPISPPPPNGTCDRGWRLYGNKCYFLQPSQPRTVLDATLTCQQMGATLVSIHNKTVNDYLTQTMAVSAHRAGSFWTNLHKSLDSGFMWVDGSPLQYTNWRPGEPTTRGLAGNDENCVEVFLSDGKWNDEDCNSKRAFICEKPLAADISSSKLATGSGINIPTPIPHSLPSILPPQIVPTIPIKKPSGVTPGHNTPNIHIPTPVTQTAETTGSVGDNSSTTGNFTGFGVTQKQTGTATKESPGTIAAIVIGAVVVVLLVAVIVLFLRNGVPQWRRERTRKESIGFDNQTYRSGSTRDDKAELTKNAVSLRTLSESST